MTIEKNITKIQEMLPELMEQALMRGIAIGYEATMKVMAERHAIETETEEETKENHDFELVLK